MLKSFKIKVLAASAATILLAGGVAALGTYALFTDKVTVTTHLVGGNMDITLERTALDYSYVDDEGMPQIAQDTSVVDFSDPTENNIFGFTENDLFVPTNYREATMVISNNSKTSNNAKESTVAYDWYLAITLDSEKTNDPEFAEQLKISVDTDLDKDGYEYTAKLSDGLTVKSANDPIGTVKVGSSDIFKVKVEFIDEEGNNNAMNQTVNFDMTVYATQVTLKK